MLEPQIVQRIFSQLIQKCVPDFSDIPVSLFAQFPDFRSGIPQDRLLKQQLLLSGIKVFENSPKIPLCYEFLNILRPKKDRFDEITLLNLLFQHGRDRPGKQQAALILAVVNGQSISAAADLMIPLFPFPVGIQPVPLGNNIVEILNRSCGILQPLQSFRLHIPLELFTFVFWLAFILYDLIQGRAGFFFGQKFIGKNAVYILVFLHDFVVIPRRTEHLPKIFSFLLKIVPQTPSKISY